jgi:hypothetical protein
MRCPCSFTSNQRRKKASDEQARQVFGRCQLLTSSYYEEFLQMASKTHASNGDSVTSPRYVRRAYRRVMFGQPLVYSSSSSSSRQQQQQQLHDLCAAIMSTHMNAAIFLTAASRLKAV